MSDLDKKEQKNESISISAEGRDVKTGITDFSSGVIVIPRSIAKAFSTASKAEILNILSETALLQGWKPVEINEVFGIEPQNDTAEKSTDNAEKNGKFEKTEKSVKAEKHVKVKKTEASLPIYSASELSDIIERRKDATVIIDECERALGKMFNTSETAKIVALIDYLELDGDYIISLCAHCAKMGKTSLRYIENAALGFFDQGITDFETLNERLRLIEASKLIENQIRKMFGMDQNRALTTREKGFFSSWIGKFGYGIDIIKKAYEITVDRTGNAKLPYANSILEKWNSEGLKTLEAIEAYETSEKEKRSGKKTAPEGSSFITDDFFEAAVMRGYSGMSNSFSDDKKDNT